MGHRKRFRIGLGVVLLLGALLRVFHFPHVPPGLNQDEVSAGYEAYSLLLTGRDRWGNPWPAYFPSWGSGQNVLYSYLSIPSIKLFGLTPLGIRSVALLFGLLILPLTYLATRNVYGRRTALAATLLVAVLPWQTMASRWGLESNLLPFFLLLGVYAVGVAAKRPKVAPLALIPWALALYAYGISFVVVPLLGIFSLFRYRGEIARNARGWALGAVLGLVVAAPFLAFIAKNNLHLGGKESTSILGLTVVRLPSSRLSQTSSPLPARLVGNARLVTRGFDDVFIWNVARSRPIPILLLLLLVGAFLRPWRRIRRDPFVLWLVATIPLFLVTDLNLNRANAMLMPVTVLCAVGFMTVLRRFSPPVRSRLSIAVAAALGLSTLFFARYYFGGYDADAGPAFNQGLDGAIAQARRVAHPGEPILLSASVEIPYLYVLVGDRVDPARFQHSGGFSVGADGTYMVPQVDGVYFDPARLPKASGSFVFVSHPGEKPGGPKGVTTPGWSVSRMRGP